MKKMFLSITCTLICMAVFSQEATETQTMDNRIKALESKVEKMNHPKLSGYVQTQWTWDRADVDAGTQNNLSIRRGRLKAAYSGPYGEAVFQLDVTESGVGIKDAYLKLQDPRITWAAFRGGVFDRPFGYEISYSSSVRESPERSRVFQTLFPKERDLGGEVILKGPENTPLQDLTLNAGLFSGNGGQAKETDSKKDFIAHLAFAKQYGALSWALGTSLYAGGVRLAGDENQKAYRLINKTYTRNNNLASSRYAKRRYYGLDAQCAANTPVGITTLRGEYLWGMQPGTAASSNSPTGAVTADIYIRKFSGFYLYLIQDIGNTKHSFIAKYDGYDPNTKLSQNECLTSGDVSFSTIGFGWLYRANQNVRIMCYYELNSNEKVVNNMMDEKYNDNIPDDRFTLRLQYKF